MKKFFNPVFLHKFQAFGWDTDEKDQDYTYGDKTSLIMEMNQ